MEILVGYTGFVGSNLRMQHEFDYEFNSKNVEDAHGLEPEFCVYAGVPGVKFLANSNPEEDMNIINGAIKNIKQINPKKLVLISTVDVFMHPIGCDENTQVNTDGLHPYGANRFYLEQWCVQNFDNCIVLRLPALFGKNLRKNFVYDLIHDYPAYLSENKFQELVRQEKAIGAFYEKHSGSFRKLVNCDSTHQKKELSRICKKLNFSAANFTDSRSQYQFYNLDYLWGHIQTAMESKMPLLHLAVEPITSGELYFAIHKKDFCNEFAETPHMYDFRTIYSSKFGEKNGYIFSKKTVETELAWFINNSRNNETII